MYEKNTVLVIMFGKSILLANLKLKSILKLKDYK